MGRQAASGVGGRVLDSNTCSETLLLDGPPADEAADALAERIDRLTLLERARKRLEALQVAEIAAFAAGRVEDPRLRGCTDDEASRGAAAEVALALGVSPGAAEHQMHAARSLVEHHPELFALMVAGEVSFAAARRVYDETLIVSADKKRQVDAALAAQVAKALPTPVERPVGVDGEAGWGDELAFWDAVQRAELVEAGALDPDDTSDPRNDPDVLAGLPDIELRPDIHPPAVTPNRLGRAAKRLVLRIDADAAASGTSWPVESGRCRCTAGGTGWRRSSATWPPRTRKPAGRRWTTTPAGCGPMATPGR